MGSNTIGSTSLQVSANSSELTAGLKECTSQINNFAKSATTQANNAFAGLGSGIGKTASSGLLGKLGGVVSAIGPLLGRGIGMALGPIGMIVGTATAALLEPLEKISELGKLQKVADTLGMSASQLQGFGLQFKKVGVDAGETASIFEQMGKHIEDAAIHQDMALQRAMEGAEKSGKGLSAVAVEGHGASAVLQRLGISAKELSTKTLEEQFLTVADAIAKLPPGAQQADLALSLFGGAGTKLLPILQKGSAGIAEFIEEAKKSGAVLGDADIRQAANAAKAVKEAKETIAMTWEGMVNKITVAVAPIVQQTAEAVKKAWDFISPVFDWITRGFQEAAFIGKAVLDEISTAVKEVIDWAKELTKGWSDCFGQFPTIKEVVRDAFQVIGEVGAVAFDIIKAGIGACAIGLGQFIKGIGYCVDAFSVLTDLLKKLPDDIRPKWIDDFTKGVDNAARNLKNNGNSMSDWGKKQIFSFGDTLKQVDKWFDKLGQAKPAIQNNLVNPLKAAAKAAASIFQPVQAALKGSKEEYEILNKFNFDSKWNNNQGQQNVQQQQLDEQKKTNDKLEKVVSAIGNIKMQDFDVM